MSSTNWSNITDDAPVGIRQAVQYLVGWIARHPKARDIDPVRVWREIKNSPDSAIGLADFAEAFRLLEKHGALIGMYGLRSQNGMVINADYSSPKQIPDKVEDIYGIARNRDDCEIALVYRVAG